MSLTSQYAIAEIKDILNSYDLGHLVDFERNERGYINTSFLIETEKEGQRLRHFLRRYKTGIRKSEIEFEHSILKHLAKKGFTLVAQFIETRQGNSYLTRVEDGQVIFYTIFEYLEGEDKYTWIEPRCSPEELSHAAALLARYHMAVVDLKPKGRRYESQIAELIPHIAERIQQSSGSSKGKVFDRYLRDNIPLILRNCEEIQHQLVSVGASEWLKLVIHSDFHPGNMKFEGVEIVALFDFDWSKIDLRCFDVGLAIWYFATDWKKRNDGQVRLRDFELFLDNYQTVLRQSQELEPLSKIELLNLPLMISAGNLFVLNWTVTDYYDKEVQHDEYMVYLRHSVNFCKWYEQKGEHLLTEVIESSLNILES